MPNKSPSPEFAQTIPTGTVAAICGIGALTLISQNLIVACLLGVIGVVIGIVALKIRAEKLDKTFAVIGIALSLVPIIYTMVTLIAR